MTWIERAAAMYRNGATAAEIAAEPWVPLRSQNGVLRNLRAHGVAIRPPGRGGGRPNLVILDRRRPPKGWTPPTIEELAAHIPTTDWWDDAACADEHPGTFFLPGVVGVNVARAVCARCPVILDCARHALAEPDLCGVWGGLSERQRDRYRRSLT